MKPVRTLIVDDEIHARRGLQTLLAGERDFEVVGEARAGHEAVAQIRALRPELVFLDVEMPDCNGLEVIREVGAAAMPAVVFVTAYDQYAVAAFDSSAIDYLLKPFTDARFQQSLARVRERVAGGGDMQAQFQHLLKSLAPSHERLQRFTVKSGDALQVFDVDAIDWVEADEYYAKLHIGDQVHLVRQTMGALDDELPSDRFARIHRSTIVNLDRIAALEPLFQGDYAVVLKSGVRLRMSRRRREALAGRLRHFS